MTTNLAAGPAASVSTSQHQGTLVARISGTIAPSATQSAQGASFSQRPSAPQAVRLRPRNSRRHTGGSPHPASELGGRSPARAATSSLSTPWQVSTPAPTGAAVADESSYQREVALNENEVTGQSGSGSGIPTGRQVRVYCEKQVEENNMEGVDETESSDKEEDEEEEEEEEGEEEEENGAAEEEQLGDGEEPSGTKPTPPAQHFAGRTLAAAAAARGQAERADAIANADEAELTNIEGPSTGRPEWMTARTSRTRRWSAKIQRHTLAGRRGTEQSAAHDSHAEIRLTGPEPSRLAKLPTPPTDGDAAVRGSPPGAQASNQVQPSVMIPGSGMAVAGATSASSAAVVAGTNNLADQPALAAEWSPFVRRGTPSDRFGGGSPEIPGLPPDAAAIETLVLARVAEMSRSRSRARAIAMDDTGGEGESKDRQTGRGVWCGGWRRRRRRRRLQVPRSIQCAICKQVVHFPVALPCHHLACLECLTVADQLEKCPHCRHTFRGRLIRTLGDLSVSEYYQKVIDRDTLDYYTARAKLERQYKPLREGGGKGRPASQEEEDGAEAPARPECCGAGQGSSCLRKRRPRSSDRTPRHGDKSPKNPVVTQEVSKAVIRTGGGSDHQATDRPASRSKPLH